MCPSRLPSRCLQVLTALEQHKAAAAAKFAQLQSVLLADAATPLLQF